MKKKRNGIILYESINLDKDINNNNILFNVDEITNSVIYDIIKLNNKEESIVEYIDNDDYYNNEICQTNNNIIKMIYKIIKSEKNDILR